jgi:TRAP-type uncharacterized transport system fused permease subunit
MDTNIVSVYLVFLLFIRFLEYPFSGKQYVHIIHNNVTICLAVDVLVNAHVLFFARRLNLENRKMSAYFEEKETTNPSNCFDISLCGYLISASFFLSLLSIFSNSISTHSRQ